MSEFIRPLPLDKYPGPTDSQLDDEPTPSARLSIVLEPYPGATIGEPVRSLVTAILSAMSGLSAPRHSGNHRKIPQMHPPGSRS